MPVWVEELAKTTPSVYKPGCALIAPSGSSTHATVPPPPPRSSVTNAFWFPQHPAIEPAREEDLPDSALRLQTARSPLGSEPITSRASLNALHQHAAINSSGSASVVVNLPSSFDAASELDQQPQSPPGHAGPSGGPPHDQHQVRISSL